MRIAKENISIFLESADKDKKEKKIDFLVSEREQLEAKIVEKPKERREMELNIDAVERIAWELSFVDLLDERKFRKLMAIADTYRSNDECSYWEDDFEFFVNFRQ